MVKVLTMITVRAGSAAISVCLLLLSAGCSREQQDWRSAEAADTIESYDQFIQRHPESELAIQARARLAQLGEDKDWQRAGSADTVEAYRQFIAQHPSGKWAQEATIRIQNFSLREQAGTDSGAQKSSAGAGVAQPGPGPASSGRPAAGAPRNEALAVPGEAATPPAAASATGSPAAKPTTPASDPTVPAGAKASATPATASHAPPTAGASPLAAPHPASPPPATKGFGIQLGAYSTEEGAAAEWRLLASRYASELQGLQQHVVPATTPTGRVYRLQAVVGEEGRARSICDLLRRRGQACVAVLPH